MALTGEEIFKLRSKWPKCEWRPQDRFLKFRLEQCENNTNPMYPTVNPRKVEILKWKPPLVDPDKIYAMLDMKSAKRVFVHTEDRLKWVAALIKESKEFAVTIKWDEQNSFLYSMALLQIAIPTHVFIIDSYALHGSINEYIKPIFTDPTIVKVFHGHEDDYLKLQFCFHIYTTGIIDTQVAHTYIYKTKTPISFEDAVFYYLGEVAADSINKDFDWADFRVRLKHPTPDSFLPPELESYCGIEAQLLLRLWSFQKHGIEAYAKLAKIQAKDVLISIYDSYRNRLLTTFTNDFLNSYVELNYTLKPGDFNHYQLKTFVEKKRYVRILNWRLETAKSYDTTPFQVISNLDASLIARKNPTNSQELLNTLTAIPLLIVRFGVEKFVGEVLQHLFYLQNNSLPQFEELLQIADPTAKSVLPKLKSEYEALSVLVNSIAKQPRYSSTFILPLEFLNKLTTKSPTVEDLIQMATYVKTFSSASATKKETSHSLGLIARNYETPSLEQIANNYDSSSIRTSRFDVPPSLTHIARTPTPVTRNPNQMTRNPIPVAPMPVPPPVATPIIHTPNYAYTKTAPVQPPPSSFTVRPSSTPTVVKKVLPMPQHRPILNVNPIRTSNPMPPRPLLGNTYSPNPPRPLFKNTSAPNPPRHLFENTSAPKPPRLLFENTSAPKPPRPLFENTSAPKPPRPLFENSYSPKPPSLVKAQPQPLFKRQSPTFFEESNNEPESEDCESPAWSQPVFRPRTRAPRADEPIFRICRDPLEHSKSGGGKSLPFINSNRTRNSFGGPPQPPPSNFGRNGQMNQNDYRDDDNYSIAIDRNENPNSEPSLVFGKEHRTATGKVICDYCNKPGHVMKYCRFKREAFYQSESPGSGNASGPPGFEPQPKRFRFNNDMRPPSSFNNPVAHIRPLLGPRGPSFNPGRFRPPAPATQTNWRGRSNY